MRATIKDVESIHQDFAGFVMSREEVKKLCREAWKDEDLNYLYIDNFKKVKLNIVFVTKAKTVFLWMFTRIKIVLITYLDVIFLKLKVKMIQKP